VQERIAPRAAQYALALEAPGEDMQELHREGWLLANLERKRGGLGCGLYGDDPLAFFLLDEHEPRTRIPVLFRRLQFFHRLPGERKISHFIQRALFLSDPGYDRVNFRVGHDAVFAERFELAVIGMLGDIERLGQPFDQGLDRILSILQNIMMRAQQSLERSFNQQGIVFD
jgi:hypothetical protein